MEGLFPLALELAVLETDLEGRGWKLISETSLHRTTSIWAHKSVLQQLCHATAVEIGESKLIWQCGIVSEAQGANGDQFNLFVCMLWELQ